MARGVFFLFLAILFGFVPCEARSRKPHKKSPESAETHLPGGRWTPEVRRALEEFISKYGKTSEKYSEDDPPVAILIWDDVSIIGNSGEAAFRRLMNRAEFKFSDEFWAILPPRYQRRALVGYNGFKSQPQIIWPKDPYYQMFRKAMVRSYLDLCRDQGDKACKKWLTQLLVGFDEGDAVDYMHLVIDEAEKDPVGVETVVDGPGDDFPVQFRTGLREVPEMAGLCRLLKEKGFTVWVFSSANYWIAQALAEHYGIDDAHVAAIHTRVTNRILQTEAIDPIPVGGGEAEAVSMLVGHGPHLAIGGKDDMALLDYGPGLKVVMDAGDEKFKAQALSRGWIVQPAFKPLPEAKPR